jgi:hypothetical protein
MSTQAFFPETISAPPKTTVRVRTALVEALRIKFQRFLEDADLIDLYVMSDMLEIHEADLTHLADIA